MSACITAYCSIKNNSLSKDSNSIFEGGEGLPLDEWLIKAYDNSGINYPKFYKMDNLSKLGVLASEALLQGRDLKNEVDPGKIGVVLSNASSSLDTDKQYFESSKQLASPALFVYTLPNIVMGEICIRHGLKGENAFFVFEQFNPEFISGYVAQVLRQGNEACIAGWAEVLGEQYNVFLYLAENKRQGLALPHTTEQLIKLYR